MSLYKKIVLNEPIKTVKFVSFAPPPVPAIEALKMAEEARAKAVADVTESFNSQIAQLHEEIAVLQNQILTNIQSKFENVITEVSGRLPNLVIALVRRLWGGLELEHCHVEEIVSGALKEISPNADKVTVTLSPEDYTIINKFSANIKESYPNLIFTEDRALNRDDCLVDSKFGKINASIERQLDKIEHEIKS